MLAQFVLFDGFDPLDVIAPFEVFSAARTFTGQVSAELAHAEDELRGVAWRDHGLVSRSA